MFFFSSEWYTHIICLSPIWYLKLSKIEVSLITWRNLYSVIHKNHIIRIIGGGSYDMVSHMVDTHLIDLLVSWAFTGKRVDIYQFPTRTINLKVTRSSNFSPNRPFYNQIVHRPLNRPSISVENMHLTTDDWQMFWVINQINGWEWTGVTESMN